jgi:ribonuclease HI
MGTKLPTVTIYTDGSAFPNPGHGGWAALLLFADTEVVLMGNSPDTTNNRMELEAACQALQSLRQPHHVRLYTDSQYLKHGITEWLFVWQARNWLKGTGQKISNLDLWQPLAAETARHKINCYWVRGHAGNVHNERVHQLATDARQFFLEATNDGTATR